MINLLTIDVEDYPALFFRDFLEMETPISSRVVESTRRIMDLLQKSGTSATFFCLGAVAREHPELIRELDNRGFEVASHGMNHVLYCQLNTAKILTDMADAKSVLEDLLGRAVRGFRAPHFNVSLNRREVIECIVEAGYTYDSSIFPFPGRRYGSPESLRAPYRIHLDSGTLIEFPLATLKVLGRRIPVAGGGYLRHFPYTMNYHAIRRLNRNGLPVTVYLHPYECDTVPVAYSRAGLKPARRLRGAWFNFLQYHGRGRTSHKIEALTRDFEFSSIGGGLINAAEMEFPAVDLRTGTINDGRN